MDNQHEKETIVTSETVDEGATVSKFGAIVEKAKGINKKILLAIVGGVGAVIIAVLLVVILNSPFSIYGRANRNLDRGNYERAIQCYQKIPEYKDSAEKCKKAFAGQVDQLITDGSYEKALEILAEVEIENGDQYKNYAEALKAVGAKEYASAVSLLEELEDFKEAKSHLNEAYYLLAEQNMAEKNYSSAKNNYSKTEGKEGIEEKIRICDIMIAEKEFKDGNLLEAKKLFGALPKDFSFEGVSVAKRLETLEKNANLVNMCGEWKGTNGKMTVRQTHDSTGLWDEWTGEYTDYLTLKCVLNDDGTFTIKGEAKYYTYTNYSSLSYLLKSQERTVSFSKTGKSIPATLYSNSSVTLKYDGSKFSLNYDFKNDNYSINFTYRYKSSITYNK